MGIQDLQRYIEAQVPNACVPVDLLKIARGATLRQPRTPASRLRPPATVQLCLVLDAERCLDRLYGGYFSDWVCGGQWSRMLQFLSVLIRTVKSNNMELAVFFNGALELSRMQVWADEQCARRTDIGHTLAHLTAKATPPPKVWWSAPTGLRTALRLALRHLQVQVVQSGREHGREVVAFCREHHYHGVVADCGEYVVLAPPRLFSAKQMKLTYKGSLETREYILSDLARGLDLQPNRMGLLAALLGSHLLSEAQLAEFHRGLASQAAIYKATPEDIVRLVLQFVRSLPSVDNLDNVGTRVFKSSTDPRVQQLKLSVEYFTNDACEAASGKAGVNRPQSAPADGSVNKPTETSEEPAVCTSSIPSDLTQKLHSMSIQEGKSQQETGAVVNGNGTSIVAGAPNTNAECRQVNLVPPALPPVPAEVMRTAADRHHKGLMSPWVYQVLTQGEIKIEVSIEDEITKELPVSAVFYRPVRERVYAILFNIYHHSFLSNQDKDKSRDERHNVPLVQIREWVYTVDNPYMKQHLVSARPLNWGVPTVQRLWFGKAENEKKRRMRAFLSCMNSDTPLMQNAIYVPHHLLILACVLRYMMTQCGEYESKPMSPVAPPTAVSVLCKPELDAFIAQALSGKLSESEQLQQLQLPSVCPRGVQLASLFMQGVEHALFANDACGAPVPWLACCPWLFFDGKLFHSYLLKAGRCRNVLELCDDQMDMVAQLDLVRQAVLEGLSVRYARPRLAPQQLAGPSALPRGGARLQVGGVVVGSWAGSRQGRGAAMPLMRSSLARGKPLMSAPIRKKRYGGGKTSVNPSVGRGMTMEPANGNQSLNCEGGNQPPMTADYDYWSD